MTDELNLSDAERQECDEYFDAHKAWLEADDENTFALATLIESLGQEHEDTKAARRTWEERNAKEPQMPACLKREWNIP